MTRNEYALANAGFAHEFQLVNVEDLNGQGENQPTPYFYQNLAEAEYIVSTYQYMRLIGYPKERIVILTTYRGQKHKSSNNKISSKTYQVKVTNKNLKNLSW